MFGAWGLVSRNTPSGGTTFYAFDERGNVAQRTGGNGALLSTDVYDGFGKQRAGAADVFGFGGQAGYYTDVETGLILCTNRHYDPQQGRFLTRDPLGYGGGINLYSYTQNNPVNWIDPLGTDTTDNTIMATFTGLGIVTGGTIGAGTGGVTGFGVGAIPGAYVGAGVGGLLGASVGALAVGLRHTIMNMSSGGGGGGAGIETGPDNEPDEKPEYKVNQAHYYDPDKDPIPDDAKDVYERSHLDPNGRARWGKGSNGNYYRYQGDHTGWHFNGEFTPKQAKSGTRCMANATWKKLNPK